MNKINFFHYFAPFFGYGQLHHLTNTQCILCTHSQTATLVGWTQVGGPPQTVRSAHRRCRPRHVVVAAVAAAAPVSSVIRAAPAPRVHPPTTTTTHHNSNNSNSAPFTVLHPATIAMSAPSGLPLLSLIILLAIAPSAETWAILWTFVVSAVHARVPQLCKINPPRAPITSDLWHFAERTKRHLRCA